MKYEEFKEHLLNNLSIIYGDSAEITTKTNHTEEGIVIRLEGSKLGSVIIPQQLYQEYQNGRPMSSIVDKVIQTVQATKALPPLSLTMEEAREHLYCTLINYEKNREVLKDVPCERYHDLAIVPRWRVSEEASFLVRNDICRQLRLCPDELLEIAMSNTHNQGYQLSTMNEVLKSLMPEGMMDFADNAMFTGPDMYVLTNPQRMDGAVIISDPIIMREVYEKIGDLVYILPSSRHETILLKQSDCPDTAALQEMVSTINATEVAESDRLSNNIYAYDGRTVTMVDTRKQSQTQTQTQEQSQHKAMAM